MIAERTQAIQTVHHIPIAPDVTYLVLPEHYEAALDVDARRWVPAADAATGPAWAGRRVWRLQKGQVARSLWQLYAFAGERLTQERQRELLAALQQPVIDRYLRGVALEIVGTQSMTHVDTLYLRLTLHVERFAATAAERRFWVEHWAMLRETAARVWDDHLASLRLEAEKDAWYREHNGAHCAPDDGEPSADEQLEQIAAENAMRAALQYGGA